MVNAVNVVRWWRWWFSHASTFNRTTFGLWYWRVRKKWVDMLKVGWRPLGWIVTRCWFDLLRSSIYFYRLCEWFHICGFRIRHLLQLFFDVKFHVIINYKKYLLNHLSLCHNRYIWWTLLNHTIIIKPELFPVRVYFTHMYRSIKFHLLRN